MRVLTLIAAFCAVAATALAAETENSNPPWFPSLQAFEHYDSGRSHVFSQAEFLGSRNQPNIVPEVRSPEGVYPSGYNMSYLNEDAAFIQGGSYGGIPPLDRTLRGEDRPAYARARLVHTTDDQPHAGGGGTEIGTTPAGWR
jgi:hypothetical protein